VTEIQIPDAALIVNPSFSFNTGLFDNGDHMHIPFAFGATNRINFYIRNGRRNRLSVRVNAFDFGAAKRRRVSLGNRRTV